MEEDDEDRGFIAGKDFMNDFATDDFINKNIRVRPGSGSRKENEDETKGGANSSKLGIDE